MLFGMKVSRRHSTSSRRLFPFREKFRRNEAVFSVFFFLEIRENLKVRSKCGFSSNKMTEIRCEDEALLKP